MPLLQEGEAAGLGGGVVASTPVEDGPGDGEGNVGVLELPHVLAKGGALGRLCDHSAPFQGCFR